jgi:hypothetical protein
MVALLVLLQVSAATPPSLDAARRFLRVADTSAAVTALIGITVADTVLGSDDIAALLLLRWIGHDAATQPRAAAAWEAAVRGEGPFFLGETGPEWSATGLVFFTAKQVARGVSDRAVDSLARGAMIRYLRPWQTRMRELAELEEARDPLLAAAARWTSVRGWLANLDRFARWVPMITPPIGCEHGCALRRSPPAGSPLLDRIREAGQNGLTLDSLWMEANEIPFRGESLEDSVAGPPVLAVGRAATLDSLWLSLNELQGRAPWPFDELAERLRVTACALLSLRVAGFECTPLTKGLDSVVGAELQVVRFEFEGRRGLAGRAMEAAPERLRCWISHSRCSSPTRPGCPPEPRCPGRGASAHRRTPCRHGSGEPRGRYTSFPTTSDSSRTGRGCSWRTCLSGWPSVTDRRACSLPTVTRAPSFASAFRPHSAGPPGTRRAAFP